MMRTKRHFQTILSFIIVTLFLFGLMPEGIASNDSSIPLSVNVSVENGVWSISGITDASSDTTEVIRDENQNVVYISQTESGFDGHYEFKALLPSSNTYSVRVGGAGIDEPKADAIGDRLFAEDLIITSSEQNGEITITASSRLFNHTLEAKQANIVLGVYEDGKLIDVSGKKSDPVLQNEYVNVSTDYTVTNVSNRYSFKAFVWENLITMKPISNTVERNNYPKNVIFMIGDGMGPNQVIYGQYYFVGADGKLTMQTLPILGNVTTRSLNSDVTDSAAAATALATGYKTNNGTVGQSGDAVPIRYKNIMEAAKEKGLCTGIVTNDQIVGATPSGFTVHTSYRTNYEDIAGQMANSCNADVLMGGNRPDIFSNLVSVIQGRGFSYVTSGDSMFSASNSNKLFGIFDSRPDLKDMARKAIDILEERDTNDKGFVLMVEETAVDGGGHGSDTTMMRNAVKRFDDAVKVVVDYAKQEGDTLVIVTADHECGGLIINALPSAPGDEGSVSWTSGGNHTGVNVNLFAYGPGSQMFSGNYDNTDIPKKLSKLLNMEDVFPAILNN